MVDNMRGGQKEESDDIIRRFLLTMPELALKLIEFRE